MFSLDLSRALRGSLVREILVQITGVRDFRKALDVEELLIELIDDLFVICVCSEASSSYLAFSWRSRVRPSNDEKAKCLYK